MTVALIPARGGSKGIPRKNLQPIANLPLVARMIKIALRGKVEEVWVSTDDYEISQVAKECGAQVIQRPPEISRDQSSTESCIDHFLAELNPKIDQLVCLLQATSPFLNPETIKTCIKTLEHNLEVNSCFTARVAHPFLWKSSQAFWEPSNHSRKYRPRRQELPESAIETGACYAFRVHSYLEQRTRFPSPSQIVMTSYLESLDIDTPEDLAEAQRIAECM